MNALSRALGLFVIVVLPVLTQCAGVQLAFLALGWSPWIPMVFFAVVLFVPGVIIAPPLNIIIWLVAFAGFIGSGLKAVL